MNLTEFVRFVVTLIAVVDPFLAVPFFLAFTRHYTGLERQRLARAVGLTVFVVLVSTPHGHAGQLRLLAA